MASLKPVLARLASGATLSAEDAEAAFDTIMSGEATPAQIAGLLMAMRVRRETVAELTGAVRAMRARMASMVAPPDAVDVCGTGGAWLVHGQGLDELTLAGMSQVVALHDGAYREFNVAPEDAGLERSPIEAIRGGDAATNAGALRALLHGECGPYRDTVLLNAAAGLIVAGAAQDLRSGAVRAAEAIDNGSAAAALDKLRQATA